MPLPREIDEEGDGSELEGYDDDFLDDDDCPCNEDLGLCEYCGAAPDEGCDSDCPNPDK